MGVTMRSPMVCRTALQSCFGVGDPVLNFDFFVLDCLTTFALASGDSVQRIFAQVREHVVQHVADCAADLVPRGFLGCRASAFQNCSWAVSRGACLLLVRPGRCTPSGSPSRTLSCGYFQGRAGSL
mmetsp:Transcript_74660/g.242613  ORF Transcript_74660/g.242613 Transcript_74660/m.242613 type:complete len:126 (-) Transcript_74660:129-506(-)